MLFFFRSNSGQSDTFKRCCTSSVAIASGISLPQLLTLSFICAFFVHPDTHHVVDIVICIQQ